MKNQLIQQKTIELNVNTNQIQQSQLVLNKEVIILFFEQHFQVWNLKTLTQIVRSQNNANIFNWTINVALNDNQFAYIEVKPSPMLYKYNIINRQSQFLCELPKQQSYFSQILYLQETDCIVIQTKGKDHKLLIFKQGKRVDFIQNKNSIIKSYNKNKFIVYQCVNNKLEFTLSSGNQSKNYSLQGIEDDKNIKQIRQFSDNIAAIVYFKQNKTHIIHFDLIFNLNEQTQIFNDKIDILYKLNYTFQGIKIKSDQQCIYQQTTKYQQTITSITQSYQKIKTPIEWLKIPKNFRLIQNNYIPILALNNTYAQLENNNKCQIIIYNICLKKHAQIKILEQKEIINNFGNGIVQEVLSLLIE